MNASCAGAIATAGCFRSLELTLDTANKAAIFCVHMHANSEHTEPDMTKAQDDITSPCHCANLRHGARAVTAFYEDLLGPTGLKVTQYSLLRQVARLGPVNMTELARNMSLDRTTLARNSRPLEAKGLIQATPGQDQRTQELSLTPKGREVLDKATPSWEHAQRKLEAHLGRENLETLLALLGQLQRLGG